MHSACTGQWCVPTCIVLGGGVAELSGALKGLERRWLRQLHPSPRDIAHAHLQQRLGVVQLRRLLDRVCQCGEHLCLVSRENAVCRKIYARKDISEAHVPRVFQLCAHCCTQCTHRHSRRRTYQSWSVREEGGRGRERVYVRGVARDRETLSAVCLHP